MSNDDPIRDALRRRADEISASEHPLGLDDVKGRARGIRRRRIAVSGLAAAAVLAVVVPAGMALDDRVTGTRDPDVAASRTPSPTSLASPTPGSQPGLLTTHVDGHSGEPGIPVVYDGKIQVPGGSPVRVKGDYDQVAALGDGWVGVGRDDQGNGFLDVLDSAGNVTASHPSTGSLAVSSDGTVLAYATPDGAVTALVAGEKPRVLGAPGGTLAPRAVIGSGTCDPDSAGGGCAVFGDDQTAGTAFSVTSKGIVGGPDKLLSVGGMSPDGRLSGMVRRSEDGSCSRIEGRGWRTCRYALGQFSPDGRYVLGHPTYGDGSGDTSLAILDAATGDVVAEVRNNAETQAHVNTAVWDKDDTVLATVYEQGTWSVMRLGLDGALTSVSGPGLPAELAGGDETTPPLRFSARP